MRRTLIVTLDDDDGYEGCVLEMVWADRERLSLSEAEQLHQYLDWYRDRIHTTE
jgi:hypothetical protein